jgi:hypothetical protein
VSPTDTRCCPGLRSREVFIFAVPLPSPSIAKFALLL